MPDVIRIMPLGDSITVGYTDNPEWNHPFEFGYRSGLYRRLKEAGFNFAFVGGSEEPFDRKYGDPTHGGSVRPDPDLRNVKQDGHRGYGGLRIPQVQQNISGWMEEDRPDLILLLIGINGISAESPAQLDQLLKTIFDTDPEVGMIVAQITPRADFNEDLVTYNACIKDKLVPAYTSRGYAIDTVDLYQHFLADPGDPASINADCFSNGFNHPTQRLYDRMAEQWFQAVKPILNQQNMKKEL